MTPPKNGSSDSPQQLSLTRFRLRKDIRIYEDAEGSAVLKDPISGRFLLLEPHELCALALLRSTSCLSDWHEKFLRQFPGSGSTSSDLLQFLLRLRHNRLLIDESRSCGDNTASVGKSRRSIFRKVLHAKLPLVQPGERMTQLARNFDFFFSQAGFIATVLFISFGLMIVLARFSEFHRIVANLPLYLTTTSIPALLATFTVIKLLHELGHAVACSHFGARVRDCGVMLFFLSPVLYTNVSDAWTLPKRQRMTISAAGIVVELLLASTFALIWWLYPNTSAKSFLINGILICSVSTLLINGNPLVRFDGYFILSDLLGRPNLYQSATLSVQTFLLSILTDSLPAAVSGIRDRFDFCYGIAICVYRTALCIGVCRFTDAALSNSQLSLLDKPLKMAFIYALCIVPVMSFVRTGVRLAKASGKRMRTSVRFAILTALAVMAANIPMQWHDSGSCVFVPEGIPIFSPANGVLTQSSKYGESVTAGDAIALLEDDNLLDRLMVSQNALSHREIQLQNLRTLGVGVSSELLPITTQMTEVAQREVEALKQQVADLRVDAESSGVLIPPHPLPVDGEATVVEQERGLRFHPLGEESKGSAIDRGRLLGVLAPTKGRVKVQALVDEEMVRSLMSRPDVEVISCSGDRPRMSGNAIEISTVSVRELPYSLQQEYLQKKALKGDLQPADRVNVVTCLVVNDEVRRIPYYSSGRIKIFREPQPLFKKLAKLFFE